jgi:hypothetical protein
MTPQLLLPSIALTTRRSEHEWLDHTQQSYRKHQ